MRRKPGISEATMSCDRPARRCIATYFLDDDDEMMMMMMICRRGIVGDTSKLAGPEVGVSFGISHSPN